MISLFWASIIGCSSIDESTFVEEYSNQYCSNIFSCVSEEDLETIEEFYGSETECASEMQSEITENLSDSVLVYNAQTAKECIDALTSIDCNSDPEEYDICNSVYTEEE